MADTEGVDQLFTGWSSVVHRPSEDPEPSDLPSTVDMNAVFNAEVNATPAANVQDDESSDSDSDSDSDSNNSGSDESGTCSQSDSSDSDSSSSSQDSNSRPASPEFSVLSSQTNGLRLTIQTVRKSCNSPTEKQAKPSVDVKPNVKCSNLSSSSSESDSDGDNDSEPKSDGSKSGSKSVKESTKKLSKKVRNKIVEKKNDKKLLRKDATVSSKDVGKKTKGKRNTKMASLPISRGSTCSSSDSDDSDTDSAMLATCSLQEINQEDLAAILPDQQEIDTFGEFECRNDKNYSQNGDASGSDMELPQQAVNALIQRTTESSSECESQEPPNPSSLCANSLLQQFFTQTPSLNASSGTPPAANGEPTTSNNVTAVSDNQNHQPTVDTEATKRKRGRPRKLRKSQATDNKKTTALNKDNVDYTADPNVSPDSGIQNSPDHVSSPEASPLPNNKTKINQEKRVEKAKNEAKTDVKPTKNNLLTNKLKEQNKLPVTSNRFDRVLYGNTDRVLYPPRRKVGRPPIHRKGPGRPPKHKPPLEAAAEAKTEETKTKVPVKQEKSEAKSRKKQQKVQDKEILQLTTNTNSLTIGKSGEIEKSKAKEVPASKKPKTFVISQICERVSRRLEQSGKIPQKTEKNNRSRNQKNACKISVLAKGKVDKLRSKHAILKNAKLMHSRHKNKKHKKYKFRILKPPTMAHPDPKINAEIEKLVQDFVKLCNISPKPVKEVVPEVAKVFKKASKKRKASDHSERKKKKQNTTSSVNKETSNEQRLPLKKRHYHLNANNDSKQENEAVSVVSVVESDKSDKKLKENKLPQIVSKVVEKKVESGKSPINKTPPNKNSSSPKASGINNNEYEVGTHIDEAIEACINKYSKDGTKAKDSPEEKTNVSMTTPKKRHLLEIANNTSAQQLNATKTNLMDALQSDEIAKKPEKSIENVVSEIKLKRMSPKFTETKKESVVQMITRKKNRLEDLTLSLVSKMNTPSDDYKKKIVKSEEIVNRASVIKYPVCKKVKPAETEKLDLVVDPKPTGIFTPTVDLELHIPKSPSTVTPNETPVKEEKVENCKEKEPVKSASEVVKIKNNDNHRKRIRKRRAINRTGFPTVKKKKKKILTENVVEVEKEESKECDRVPKEGEEYATFVQRTECQVTLVALEKLPPPPPPVVDVEDTISKWEVLSECDSLPQEERTEFEDLKPEKKRDISPATSIETRSSDRIKKRREFTPDGHTDDDITLEARLLRSKKFSRKHRKLRELRGKDRFRLREERDFVKRKLRDVSPASSIEPSTEKRLRDDRGSASGDDKKNKKAPRWRKKYLVAGLFSDYYKEDDEISRQKRAELVSNKSRLVYNPEEHPYGLLPAPYHCGKYLRCRKIPFQLPYDLWWQHAHSQLPGRDTVPSWNYRKVRTNVYNVKLTTTGVCEPQSCNCGPTSSCGDDCINRLVLVECPASHKCQNQRIQKHDWAPGLEKFMTESKGWGVRTNLPIKTGEFILEYVGEVVSDQEFKERMATRYVHDTHHYCLHLDCGLVIDGHRMGGDGRFVNHSCQPNCEMQKWSVNGQSRMALFALRNIAAGEELTYDYNFSLFNPAEGQECKCGSDNCRGVIGGKSQRVRQSTAPPPVSTGPGRVGRPRKNQAKKALSGPKDKETPIPPAPPPVVPVPQLKPLTHAQKIFIQEHHCFLLRNFYKVRRCKAAGSPPITRAQTSTPTEPNASTTLINHINALRQPRNIKTRRLAQVEDDPELHKAAKLANLLRDLWNAVTKVKDEKGAQLCAPFLSLPSKRKVPEYYQRIQNPIDFNTIEQNVASGVYRVAESFDLDMNKLFANAIKFYGRTSEFGIAATRLKKIYMEVKQQNAHKFEDTLGEKPPLNFISNKNKGEEEDVIRCICGMYRDEGLMIQCERCLVWQHCECVKADAAAASYHCERCVPREVDYEIPLDEYTEHGYRYYMTLMRGTLQLRQGDTVYVLRDIPIPGTTKKHTYDTVGSIKYADLDIFRIERLWKDFKGQRIAYGHHYLRPHETYHEPTRKFFPNEVMRVPLYEAVPVELIIEHCWVMDLNTYCKGRPIGAPEEHIYICEYRVDKTARLFSKVSKSKFPVCVKSYSFERFDARLKISRTYTPHDLDPAHIKPRGRKPQDAEEGERREVQTISVHIPIVRTRTEQKARLNKILLNLLNKLPTKQPLDVSYLLEGGRRRKKTT